MLQWLRPGLQSKDAIQAPGVGTTTLAHLLRSRGSAKWMVHGCGLGLGGLLMRSSASAEIQIREAVSMIICISSSDRADAA